MERSAQSGAEGGGATRSASRHLGAAPIAALDLGTNNCRLLVARPQREGVGFDVLDSFSRAVRLGEAIDGSGALAERAIERSLDALSVCADKIRRNGVRRVRAVATEACRRAVNGRDFVERARARTGIRLDIISAEDEARLAVAGCAPLLDPETEELLVIDIGGGSTELVWIDFHGAPPHLRRPLLMALAPQRRGARWDDPRARAAAAHIVDWVSAPVGVATLQERFGHLADPAARFAAMSACFEEKLAAFSPIARAGRSTRFQMIGASGTVTTIAGVHLGLRRYDRNRVDGMWLPTSGAARVIEELVSLDDAARSGKRGVGPDRSVMIVAGAAILSSVMSLWPTDRLRVADRGLREGLLYAMLAESAPPPRPGRPEPAESPAPRRI